MTDGPIVIGFPDIDTPDACGCCEGTAPATSNSIANRPNLSAIAYRVGDHGRFKASMLTALASAEHAALGDLGTRADDDFSIALIDAWASVCEVLSFYQERHANEAFIGTSLERFSIGEIARLIGYRLPPGAAAETDLVLLMDDPPGAVPDVTDLDVPAGTRVQSQPGPDEQPQVFATLDDLTARVAWNALRPRQSRYIAPDDGDAGVWLDGVASGVNIGDAVLVACRQRIDPGAPGFDVGSDRWDFRKAAAVDVFPNLGRTRVTFDRPLDSVHLPGTPARGDHRFFVLADRASLFGFNAPHPRVLSAEQRATFGYVPGPGVLIFIPLGGEPSPSRIKGDADNPGDWDFFFPGSAQISLDAVYKGFVKGGWVVLTVATGTPRLYGIDATVDDGESRYAVSGRTTRLTFDTSTSLSTFRADYRRVSAYGASREIRIADAPLFDWVSGSDVELDLRAADLPEERRLIFAGRRAQVLVQTDALTIAAEDAPARIVGRGTRLTLLAPPQPVPSMPGTLQWELRAEDGYSGLAQAAAASLAPVAADADVETIAAIAILDHVEPADSGHTRLLLASAPDAAFDRATVTVHGNVARASHGEGVTEILGSGDPSRPFQKFVLKQNPVTHLVAATENGVASTLRLRVDGVLWQELPDLYAREPNARVYATRLTDDGQTVIGFGEGRSGARPHAGRDNIVAEYRKGLGLAGNVRAGQLSLPLDRPLGLRDVTNPLPATGGDDAESAADARRNAPIYTLTLGRVVSLTDFRDFALGYPGIAKADARWVWEGETRRVVVTVAGPGGSVVAESGPTYPALLEAFRDRGDPFVQVDLLSYEPVHFRLGLRVAVAPDRETDTVLSAVEAALRDGFSFDAQAFAEPVALSQVAAMAHRVAGVVAVDIDRLYRDVAPQTAQVPHRLLVSRGGRRGAGGTLLPAEILTLSPEPFDSLEPMS